VTPTGFQHGAKETSMDFKSTTEIADAEEQHGFAVDAFLRASGWRQTCENPASLWLWETRLKDGRIVMVSRDTALTVQRALEASL
jgi:hypothetical protein